MQNPRLAARYAKSLADLAIEQNSLDATLKDVQALQSVCNQNPDFVTVLQSPIINGDKKLAVIKAVFGANISKLTMSFMVLLVNKGRETTLPEIATAFISLYKEMKSIRTVTLTTAVPVADDVKASIKSKVAAQMTNSTVELETAVNPELIGGFVLEMDDRLFDASIRAGLDKLKAQFHDDSYVSKV